MYLIAIQIIVEIYLLSSRAMAYLLYIFLNGAANLPYSILPSADPGNVHSFSHRGRSSHPHRVTSPSSTPRPIHFFLSCDIVFFSFHCGLSPCFFPPVSPFFSSFFLLPPPPFFFFVFFSTFVFNSRARQLLLQTPFPVGVGVTLLSHAGHWI